MNDAVRLKQKSQPPAKRVLGVFSLASFAIAAILSIRSLPIAAVYGYTSITYYLLAALLFFLPTALICAELATTWPEAGGLYAWVKRALGPHFGFIAIWLEWINTVIAFPMMIGFIVFTLLYPFAHHLVQNRWFDCAIMLVIFWSVTAINLLGIKISSRFGNISVILGTLCVIGFMIALACYWWLSGRPIQHHFQWRSLIPSMHLSSAAFLIGMINGFSGIQIIAFHAQETRCPKTTFKKVIPIVFLIIVLLSILGTLAVVMVMPTQSSDLIGGIVRSLGVFLAAFHLQWLLPIIVVLIAIGILSEVNAWMIGPSKGLLVSAEQGDLPAWFAYKNKKQAPVSILCMQALMGSLLGSAYIFMPSVNSGYWLLSDMTAQFTIMMWVLLFISAIVLRFKYSKTPRAFQIPGGRLTTCVMAGVGIIVCVALFVVSYIPPTSVIRAGSVVHYELFLSGGLLIFIAMPLLWRYMRKRC